MVNFKGDWKYLKQLFLFTKDASKEKAGKMMPASSSFLSYMAESKNHGKISVALLCHFHFGLRRRCAGCVSAQKAVMT